MVTLKIARERWISVSVTELHVKELSSVTEDVLATFLLHAKMHLFCTYVSFQSIVVMYVAVRFLFSSQSD